MKLSEGEKLILAMLCDLSKHLQVQGEIDPDFVKAAVFGGHAWGLEWQYGGIFHGHEDSEDAVREVGDIMQMWWILESSYAALPEQEKKKVERDAAPFGRKVEFLGFDGNNEGEQLGIAHFLIRHLERFEEFKGRDLNSHSPSLPAYRRMLATFQPMLRGIGNADLDATQITEVLKAQIHPDRR